MNSHMKVKILEGLFNLNNKKFPKEIIRSNNRMIPLDNYRIRLMN